MKQKIMVAIGILIFSLLIWLLIVTKTELPELPEVPYWAY